MREQGLLQQYFPRFRIQNIDDPATCGVVGKHRTNSGRDYALWIPLGGFPNQAPCMYLVYPTDLKDASGGALADHGPSHAFHLLRKNQHGHPQICHYNGQFWHPNVTLYKIVMKGRIWLEAYEQHLATGHRIDRFLRNMDRGRE